MSEAYETTEHAETTALVAATLVSLIALGTACTSDEHAISTVLLTTAMALAGLGMPIVRPSVRGVVLAFALLVLVVSLGRVAWTRLVA